MYLSFYIQAKLDQNLRGCWVGAGIVIVPIKMELPSPRGILDGIFKINLGNMCLS